MMHTVTHTHTRFAVLDVSLTARSFRDSPHLLLTFKDMKLGFYTVPTGNRNSGHCMAVHYTTAAPRQHLHTHIITHSYNRTPKLPQPYHGTYTKPIKSGSILITLLL